LNVKITRPKEENVQDTKKPAAPPAAPKAG
jgi:hypothetical protein